MTSIYLYLYRKISLSIIYIYIYIADNVNMVNITLNHIYCYHLSDRVQFNSIQFYSQFRHCFRLLYLIVCVNEWVILPVKSSILDQFVYVFDL